MTAREEAAEIVALFVAARGRPPRSLAELESGLQCNLFAVYRYDIIDAINKVRREPAV